MPVSGSQRYPRGEQLPGMAQREKQVAQCDDGKGRRDDQFTDPDGDAGKGDALRFPVHDHHSHGMVGDDAGDQAGKQFDKNLCCLFQAFRQADTAHEDIDGDVMFLAGGDHRPNQAHPQHQQAQRRCNPAQAAVEEISQDDLRERQCDHGAQQQHQKAVFEGMEQAQESSDVHGCQ